MRLSYDRFGEKERKEAKRFDKEVTEMYKNDSRLIIEPVHWEKFDTEKPIPNPYAYVVQSLGDLTGKKVLEVGCGTGGFSIILAKRGAQLIKGFDISKKSIEIARKRAKINDVAERVNFRAISIYDMDYHYKNNFFDFVVGLAILHHIDIERVVEKIYSCLKPGGTAYFEEPFGNVLWLERLRLLIPVKVNEEDESHWQEKLTYKDVEKFRAYFKNIQYLEFHLFSRLDRIIKFKPIISMLAITDEWLLKFFPFLRKYARRIVIKLTK